MGERWYEAAMRPSLSGGAPAQAIWVVRPRIGMASHRVGAVGGRLQVYKGVYGETHPSSAMAMHNTALLYQRQGQGSHRRFAPPLIHFIPDSCTYSVPYF